MDYAALVGIGTVIALVFWCMVAGSSGEVGIFWSLPALLLVLGGAVAATLASCARSQLGWVIRVVHQAFTEPAESSESTIDEMVRLAHIARRDGLLAVDAQLPRSDERFLARAMRLVVDGYEPAAIMSLLSDELEATDARHMTGRQLLEMLAKNCPVFGMMGTVIGLVVMLRSMNDPAKVGPGMAVALLTTMYGLVLANAVFYPIAQKLAHRSAGELLTKTIIMRGVLAIQQGDNPRVVEQKLRAFLPNSSPRTARTLPMMDGLNLSEALEVENAATGDTAVA